jgi:hypothetical protein
MFRHFQFNILLLNVQSLFNVTLSLAFLPIGYVTNATLKLAEYRFPVCGNGT